MLLKVNKYSALVTFCDFTIERNKTIEWLRQMQYTRDQSWHRHVITANQLFTASVNKWRIDLVLQCLFSSKSLWRISWRKYKISILISMISLFTTIVNKTLNFLNTKAFLDYLNCVWQTFRKCWSLMLFNFVCPFQLFFIRASLMSLL